MRRNQNHVFGLFVLFKFFFPFLFSFSYLFAAVIERLQDLFKHFGESIIETGSFYHGVAKCGRREFCREFFTQISEHFRAYLRLHLAHHPDLGISGKIFSSCGT